MFFDVRGAKLLKPGGHLAVEGCEGLRLAASASKQTWAYRYKSPATGLMKQTAIGPYPRELAASRRAELNVTPSTSTPERALPNWCKRR
jgi:hypothetical protein